MADSEKLRGALEIYLQQKQQKLEEVRELDQIIARLRRDLGEAPVEQGAEYPSDSMAPFLGDKLEMGLAPALGGRANVRPDEFFGMTYTMAAKAYLEKVRHAVSMDELLEALNRGGCPVGGREPKKTLYISLVRDVRSFVPIPGKSGFLGLRAFYPNLKAAKDKNDEKEPKRKHKKGRKKNKVKNSVVIPKAKESQAKNESQPLCSRGCGKAPHRGSCKRADIEAAEKPKISAVESRTA